IATPAHAELASNVGSGLASYLESELTKGFLQPFGTLSVRMAEIWEPFGEDLLSTYALLTKETAHMHDETDWTPDGWKVTQHACVATLDTRRCGPTGGAR